MADEHQGDSYDLLVIGSGPGGQKAAIHAAKLGKRVALVERSANPGGVSVNSGTIPSKSLREAVLYLTGYRQRGFYGASYSVKQNISMKDLMLRTDTVVDNEVDVTRLQLMRNDVELFTGSASLVDSHVVKIADSTGQGQHQISAAKIVIATGSEATKNPETPFDGRNIIVSDDIFSLDRIPRTLAVVGAGVIGCEFASFFATLGVQVT